MKCILSDFRRALAGRWFLIAVFASILALWASVGSQSWYFSDMLQSAADDGWADLGCFLQSALTGQLGLLLLPALSALPFASEALHELRSGVFRPAIFRTGKADYIAGQTLGCMVSGMLVQLFAFAGLTLFIGAASVIIGGGLLPASALADCLPLLLGRILCGGGWALIGCILALITETSSAAMLAPLCLCYAITMISTRFFPDAALLSPLSWQSAPPSVLALAVIALLLAACAALNREVKRYV